MKINRRKFIELGTAAALILPSASHAANRDILIGGQGSPSIVLIHGLGADIASSFSKIFPMLAQISTTYSANRMGYGKVKYDKQPRNGILIAQEIYQSLQSAKIPPPYLIIGHSLGGVYAQYFARIYANETMGLILIDPAVPGQIEFLEQNYPTESATLKMIMKLSGKAINDEFVRSRDIYDALLKLPPYQGATRILMANIISGMDNPLPYRDFRRERIIELAKYYNAKLEYADCGHFIQNEKPNLIINAVNELIGTNSANNNK